jgi:hypothetical protein
MTTASGTRRLAPDLRPVRLPAYRRLWLAVALLVLGGWVALMVLSIFRQTVLQACVPDEMRGRLQGAVTVVSAGGPWVAHLAHGTAGAAFGTTWAITGGGLLTVAAMLLTAALFPELVRYRAERLMP